MRLNYKLIMSGLMVRRIYCSYCELNITRLHSAASFSKAQRPHPPPHRHRGEVRDGAGGGLPRHAEPQPLRSRVHQLELHLAEGEEVHGQEGGRRQSRPGQPQLLQVGGWVRGGSCAGAQAHEPSGRVTLGQPVGSVAI